MAVIGAVNAFKLYLNIPFTIRTDCVAIAMFFDLKKRAKYK